MRSLLCVWLVPVKWSIRPVVILLKMCHKGSWAGAISWGTVSLALFSSSVVSFLLQHSEQGIVVSLVYLSLCDLEPCVLVCIVHISAWLELVSSSYMQSLHTSTVLSYEKNYWLVPWHSGRTLVFDRRAFAVLRSTYSWRMITYVGKPSAIGQPTRLTQPFVLSGSINE